MHEEVADNPGSHWLLARVQIEIGDTLREAEQLFFDELQHPRACIRELLDHLANYRGKRLRPILLLLAGKACGGLTPAHRTLAAVVEMIHTATLVHDDVLDDAVVRRHVQTVNARWSNQTSVLLGDYLFTHAFHLTSSLGEAQACRTIGRATNVVCAGELTQIAERGNFDLSEEQYLEIIEAKTAELCAVACSLGAHYAGAGPAVAEALDGFGRALGIAFQIADDLLDVLGSEEATGKSLGSDLRQHKLTLPLIYHLAQSPRSEAAEVRRLLAVSDATTREALEPRLEQSGAIHYARARATEFVVAARQHLSCLPDSPAKQLLEDIADFSTRRTA